MSSGSANPYQSPSFADVMLAASATETARAAFIRKTYLHLAGAVLAFIGLEALIFTLVPPQTLMNLTIGSGGMMWLVVLGVFMVVSWIATSWAESSASRPLQYLGLGLFVVAESLIFVPLLVMAVHFTRDPYLIPSAGLITLITFGGLTAAVLLTGKDFSFLRTYLWWGVALAFGAIVVALVFGFSLGVWFMVAMVALASGYILYHTSNVLHHYRTDQYVAAALALFASVALLLWYVVQLLLAFRD